jgi:hypothetical protein
VSDVEAAPEIDAAFRLELPCGRVAVIDEDDVPFLHGWLIFSDVRKHTVYVRCRRPGMANRNKYVYLHKMLTGFDMTDHENGNGLDCRRENLRTCDDTQNACNKKAHNGRRFKGVYSCSWDRTKWVTWVTIDGRTIRGGVFTSEEDAARRYDELARQYHGEFARLNFPVAHVA